VWAMGLVVCCCWIDWGYGV